MTSDVAVANREGHPVSGGTSPTHIGISVNFIRTDRPARYSSVSRGSFVVHVVVSVAGAIISVPVMVPPPCSWNPARNFDHGKGAWVQIP